MLLDLLTVVILAWFGSRLYVSFRTSLSRDGQAAAWPIVRGLRARHFVPVPFVLAAVAVTAWLLVQLPVLSFGWWTAIGGVGNPAFGVTERNQDSILAVVIPLVFVILLAPALPLLVRREEEIFRLGAERWSGWRRAQKVLLFGLAHALVGIPIGVALALSIGGGYFMWGYLRAWRATGSRYEALLESTRRHLAYNALIVGIVGLVLALDLVIWIAVSV